MRFLRLSVGRSVPRAFGLRAQHRHVDQAGTVPYLNLFCDPTMIDCNATQAAEHMQVFRQLRSNYSRSSRIAEQIQIRHRPRLGPRADAGRGARRRGGTDRPTESRRNRIAVYRPVDAMRIVVDEME